MTDELSERTVEGHTMSAMNVNYPSQNTNGDLNNETIEQPCACVHHDPRECARMRDGKDYWHLKRLCECVCHYDYYDDDDD